MKQRKNHNLVKSRIFTVSVRKKNTMYVVSSANSKLVFTIVRRALSSKYLVLRL